MTSPAAPLPGLFKASRAALLSAVGGGAIIGFLEVAFILSFASLVFVGASPLEFARGLGFLLVGGAVLNLIGARWSSLPGAVVMPQDTSTAIIAATAGTIMASAHPDVRFESMVLYLAACSVLTGLVMLLLGVFRRGGLIRFVPLPVIGGFLAGTGYLLLVGGAELTTGGFVFGGAGIWALVGAGSLAAGLVLWLRWKPNVLVVPAAIMLGLVAFFVLLWVTGTSLEEARSLGLLPASTATVLAWPVGDLTSGDWSVLRAGLGGLLTVPLVATLGMLLNVSALEMISESDSDLDGELRTVGAANLAASLTGSVAGYHGLGLTALGYRVGVASRLVPATAALVLLVAFLVGGTLISLVPTPLIGATLMFLGLSFLTDWFVDARRQMTGPEVLLMAALVVAVATIGFIAAVALGMVAAVIMFVVAYSRIDPVRHAATGTQIRSSIDRPPGAEKVLAERAGAILVVELQGYLFFGTSKTVVEKVVGMMEEASDLRCLVIDMRHVDGADTTSVAALAKLARIVGRKDCAFLVSQVPQVLQDDLVEAMEAHPNASTCVDLDHALEIAEEMVIGELVDPRGGSLEEVFGPRQWKRLRPLLRERTFDRGDEVIRFGEDASSILMVHKGRIDTEIPTNSTWRRVRSSGPGTVVGEISLYRSGGRTARVVATEPSIVFELDGDVIAGLEVSDPRLAVQIHRALAALMAERVASSNATVASLLR